MQKLDLNWFAFLALTFLVVGATGLFATFAAPIPAERALAREQALDEAALAARAPDAVARLEALRPRLGDSAAALLPAGGDMAARIAAERLAMRARFAQDAAATARRLHWLIGVATLASAAFGCALLGAAASQNRRNPTAVTSNTRVK
jgi:hypothetical protein